VITRPIILFVTSLLLNSSAFGFSGQSLTWQKLALEEKIQRKMNQSISTVLKDNQYLVEVEADVNEPGAPNFGNDDKKNGPRVSDLNISESRGDYIAFSKIGLEVPVVDKFLDEDKTKLMNLYRYNESYDLFKNLAEVRVTVFLSDKLPPDLVDIVKKVVSSSKLMVAGIKPSVKFENIPMEWKEPVVPKKEEPKKKPEAPKPPMQYEPKIWTKDWLEWASRWGNAFGMILGALILGIIATMLFRQWKAFMEAFVPKPVPELDKKEEDEEDKAALDAAANQSTEEDVASIHGLERFKQCLEQHPDEAITIVRSWLNDGEEHSLLALRGLAQQASAEEMEKLLAGLSQTQRDKWKGLLTHHLEQAEINNANKQIFQDVVKSLLVPSRIKDGELLNLIMELDAKTTCEFLEKYEDQVGIMMNLLGPSIVAKILTEASDETAEKWLALGGEFDVKEMDSNLDSLKSALESYKEEFSPAPFAQRLMSMIPTASPSREGSLFRALAKSGSPAMLFEAARKCFPSELVLDLPAPVIREVIQSYPMAKRVEFLFSRPEESRATLIDSLAEPGTPARDMIDMELENIERDTGRQSSIVARTEEIWFDFVKLTRTTLQKNSAHNSVAEQMVTQWCSKIAGLKSMSGGKAA